MIISDEAVASGIRRIEAVAGAAAIDYLQAIVRNVVKTANIMKADNMSIAEKTDVLVKRSRELEKENELLKERIISLECNNYLSEVKEIKGIKVLSITVKNYDAKALRFAADELLNRMKSGVVLLGSDCDSKASLTAAVSRDLVSKVKAGDIVRNAAVFIEGKGGGRPDMAQAGGTKVEGLAMAIASVETFLESSL